VRNKLHTRTLSSSASADKLVWLEIQQMRRLSRKIAAAVFAVVVCLTIGGTGQVKNKDTRTPSPGSAKAQQQQPPDVPLCNGDPTGSSAGHTPSQVNPHPHSVTLSWNATVPASNAPRDAIKGYYVYRSLASHTYAESDRISPTPLRGTRCVDTTVEPRKTYFYVVKAVTEGGAQSGSSSEIKAVVPFP
jgi:hypothetical protein